MLFPQGTAGKEILFYAKRIHFWKKRRFPTFFPLFPEKSCRISSKIPAAFCLIHFFKHILIKC